MRYLFSIVISVLVLLSPAQARWHEVRTDNFIVAGDASLPTLKKFAIELEQFRVFLAVVSGQQPTPEPVPVEVYLMTNVSSLKKIFDRRNIGGVYTTDIEKGIFAANVSKRGDEFGLSARDILFHEYVHHYSYRTGPFYYPRWYREGIADFFATFEYDDGVGEVGRLLQQRIDWLANERWFPLEYLIRSKLRWYKPNDRDLDAEEISLYYAQSWFTVHYLQNNPKRSQQLTEYLQKVREGGEPIATFVTTFKASIDVVEREVEKKFESGRLPLLRINLEKFYFEPELEIAELDSDEERVRLALAGSYFGMSDEDERADKLAALEQALAQNPDDTRLLYRLAIIHFDADKPDLARPFVERAVVSAPNKAETMILEGLSLRNDLQTAGVSVEQFQQALQKFDVARKADPKNPRAHYEYSRMYVSGSAKVTEEVVDAALLALELSPDPFEVPFNAAVVLGRRGYTEDAKYLLEGLASWTSNLERQDRARRALEGL